MTPDLERMKQLGLSKLDRIGQMFQARQSSFFFIITKCSNYRPPSHWAINSHLKQVQAHLDKLFESVGVLDLEAGVSSQQTGPGKWEKCFVEENEQVTSAAQVATGRGSGDN